MAYRPNKLGRIAIKIQGSGWGTPETSFASTNYIEAEVGVPKMVREALRMDPIRSGFEEPEVLAGSRAGVEIPVKFPLHGWSTATPSTDATEHPDALLIRLALGAAVQTGYVATNIASGSTTSSVKFTAGNTNWEGSGMLIPTSGTPGYEIIAMSDIDTTPTPDAGVPLITMQRTPSSSGTHYGSNTIYLTNDTPSPITMDWIGIDAGHHVRYSDGLVKSLKITGSAKKGPMLEAVIRFTGTTSFPGSGGSLAAYVYGFPLVPASIAANGAAVYFNGSWIAPSSEVVFSVDVDLQDVEGWGSPEGVAQQLVNDRKVKATLLMPSTATFTTDILAPGTAVTKFMAIYACGTPGRAAGFVLPAPTLTATADFADRSGLLAISYETAPQVFSSDGSAGAGAGNKSCRFLFA